MDLPIDEPLVFELLRRPVGAFHSLPGSGSAAAWLPTTSRGALAAGAARYDVIEFALSEPFRPVAAGAFSLTEYYALTWQALSDAMPGFRT